MSTLTLERTGSKQREDWELDKPSDRYVADDRRLEGRIAELEVQLETRFRSLWKTLFDPNDIKDMAELSKGMFEDSLKIQSFVARIRENTR